MELELEQRYGALLWIWRKLLIGREQKFREGLAQISTDTPYGRCPRKSLPMNIEMRTSHEIFDVTTECIY